jgi:hypothetical protein
VAGAANQAFKFIAMGLLMLAGFVLLVASPMLLILGGWGGADSGSVLRGIGAVFGLPWLTYLGSAAGAALLLHYNRPFLACLPAIIPVAIETWLLAGWLARQAI